MPKIQQMDGWLMAYGEDLNIGLAIVLGAVLAAGLLVRVMQNRMRGAKASEQKVVLTTRVVYVVFTIVGVLLALHTSGLQWVAIRRVLFAVILMGCLLVLALRRYIPPLPFRAGDMVEVAGLLGLVESISVVNTRVKAFDGRTFFVPNSVIMKDKIINYHFTPNRRVDLAFGIGYKDDLLNAKAVLAEMLAEDPRILGDPAPRVFVTGLDENAVNVRLWAWTNNSDYFRTRCDFIEKVKLRFGCEGITIAYPQVDVHLYREAEVRPPECEGDGRQHN
jgi:small conductance mechanosensitive channel